MDRSHGKWLSSLQSMFVVHVENNAPRGLPSRLGHALLEYRTVMSSRMTCYQLLLDKESAMHLGIGKNKGGGVSVHLIGFLVF